MGEAATQKNIDDFMSFRNTMNIVVPKSYGLSDEHMVGMAAYVCSQLKLGEPETFVIMAIPGLVQRTDPDAPEWTQEDSKYTVDKAQAVYCPEYQQ